MQQLTYRQAYDKIIDAYFKDEIQPLEERFCFCGTLNNNSPTWNKYGSAAHRYSYAEFKSMELPLLNIILEKTLGRKWKNDDGFFVAPITVSDTIAIFSHPHFEDALFQGMCAALEVLKQIHRDRGENVDEDIPTFTKRQLAKDH